MCLAMLGGYALAWAWSSDAATTAARRTVCKMVSALLVAGFIAQQVPVARRTAQWHFARGQAQRTLVLGVERAHELHPGKVILLDGVTDDLFWGAIQQRPFLFLKIPHVYLTPGSEAAITQQPNVDAVSRFVLPIAEVTHGLANGQIVVYRADQGPLRNITREYVPSAGAEGSSVLQRIDAADPVMEDRLGQGWYPAETGIRWMARAASVRMPGPRMDGEKLYVTAMCPPTQLVSGPMDMAVSVDGVAMTPVRFRNGEPEKTFDFALPPSATGKGEIVITVEVGHTVRTGADVRDLGLAFGRFEIK
jgi:hypothetical protein